MKNISVSDRCPASVFEFTTQEGYRLTNYISCITQLQIIATPRLIPAMLVVLSLGITHGAHVDSSCLAAFSLFGFFYFDRFQLF